MENLFTQKVINANSVFDTNFLDTKVLYVYRYNTLPSINLIDSIDGGKAFKAFSEKFGADILYVHDYKRYQLKKKRYDFDKTVVIMGTNCIVEFDEYYCEIFHDGSQPDFINEISVLAGTFKERQRKQPQEINLIVKGKSGLELRSMEIKRTRLDLALFYEDNFKTIDETIRKRLNQKKDKGIVLLHGLPGTGKTTYLRYLIGKIKKRVMFLSPNIAVNLMNPDFIDLLINNPDTVIVIEDAENIIMDRRLSGDSSVSNLLNISDGLLADFLNVQLICTFNSSLTLIDTALMRKGRLIAKYEFGKLGIEKAQRLSKHFGYDTIVNTPMTVAEISNQHERTVEVTKHIEVLGFRRDAVMEN